MFCQNAKSLQGDSSTPDSTVLKPGLNAVCQYPKQLENLEDLDTQKKTLCRNHLFYKHHTENMCLQVIAVANTFSLTLQTF